MNSIKCFVYLDKHKMYSISSQIFEGLTEYILDYSSEGSEELTEQKGPLGSGRILGDIISKEAGKEQKRFLHDYSYTLFEKKLSEDNKVLVVNSDNIVEIIDEIANYSFIRVSGKASFNDMKLTVQTLNSFNEFGSAITYVTTHQEMNEQKAKADEQIRQIKDRNQRAVAKNKAKNAVNIDKLAKELGLNLDQKLLEKLAFLLEYGYKDQFELQMPINLNDGVGGKLIFSAVLNRSILEEEVDILIKRFSRLSEKQFTLFGMITQHERDSLVAEDAEGMEEAEHLKQALMVLNTKFSAIEDSYIGRLPNEVIIDPIAVYREL